MRKKIDGLIKVGTNFKFNKRKRKVFNWMIELAAQSEM